jgi:hypothetical protein
VLAFRVISNTMSESEPPLETLFLEQARLQIKLRKRFRVERTDPNARYYTYALLLQNECVYVGSTNCLYMRLMEHLHETAMSAQWVREHGPVIRVLEVSKNCKGVDEAYKTLEYMTMFGWESVRGAGWARVDMRGPPAALHEFVRTRTDFEYLGRKEIDEAIAIARDLASDMASDV